MARYVGDGRPDNKEIQRKAGMRGRLGVRRFPTSPILNVLKLHSLGAILIWAVQFDPDFEEEFETFDTSVQDALLAVTALLIDFGPRLGRPHADTLNGSAYGNMKELRFNAAGGVWRAAFAFDPSRRGIVLVAGDKAGINQKRFYEQLIAKADRRYALHLAADGDKR